MAGGNSLIQFGMYLRTRSKPLIKVGRRKGERGEKGGHGVGRTSKSGHYFVGLL